MKNKNFIFFMIGIILSFVFVSNGYAQSAAYNPTPTQFEGVWKHPNPESLDARITFTGNSFSYQYDNENINGHFTFDRRSIQFLSSDGSVNWSTTYTLNRNVLRLNQGTGGFWWYGDFYFIDLENNKKLYENIVKDSVPTNLEGTWVHPNRESQNARFVFSGNSFSYQTDNENISGLFSVNGRNIQFLTGDGFINWAATFSLSGRNLTFTQGTGGFGWYGTFNKRDN